MKVIKNDLMLNDFYHSRNIAPSTKKSYDQYFIKFYKFTNKTPSDLLKEAEKDEDNGLRPRERRIREYFLQFLEQAKKEDLSANYTKGIITTIRVFLNEYDIELPKINFKIQEERDQNINDIPNIRDIKLALSVSSLKFQAIILLMISSGMGRAEILNLKYNDFLNSISDYCNLPNKTFIDINEVIPILDENRHIIGNWYVQRMKTKKWYYTFSTWESLNKISEYLKTHPPEHLETKIFRSKYKDHKGIHDKPLTGDGFITYFHRLNRKCNFGSVGRQSKFRSHSLRKFFVNAMLRSGTSKLAIDWMIGHEITDRSAAPYFKSDPKYIKEEYMKGINQITTERVEIRRIETDEYKKLIRELDKKDEKITAMEKRMEELEKENRKRNETLDIILKNPVVLKEFEKNL